VPGSNQRPLACKATETGGPQGPSNVRRRILAKAVERANENRAEDEVAPLPDGLTPHSLRRTFASVLFALGRELPYVVAQLGHSDPKMTLGVYARVMTDGSEERERLRALTEGGRSPRLTTVRRHGAGVRAPHIGAGV